MRFVALIALASFGVLGVALPCAAQTETETVVPRTVTVPKQVAPRLAAPQRFAPPEPQGAAAPQQVQAPSPYALPAPSAPVQVYATTPQPMPASVAPAQASPEPQGAFTSPERLMDWISTYRKHPNPSRVPAAVHAMQEYGLFTDEEKAWFCTCLLYTSPSPRDRS